MESRRIPGRGLEHEQDYIEERIEDTGGGADYERASEKLEQEAEELKHLVDRQESANTSSQPKR